MAGGTVKKNKVKRISSKQTKQVVGGKAYKKYPHTYTVSKLQAKKRARYKETRKK